MTEEAAAVGESLKPLLDLQSVDLTHDRLEDKIRKLPERDELAAVEARIADTKAALDVVNAQIDRIVREIGRLESEVSSKEAKIAAEEGKLYGGRVTNPKEVSALQSELEMLKRQKGPLEEQAIEQMVLRDERYEDRDRLERDMEALEAEAGDVRRRIEEASGRLRAQISAELAKREQILTHVPADVLDDYEELRKAKKGVGAGELRAGICTACGEALSAVVMDRIKQSAKAGQTRFRCEHCRRILVVA